MKRFLLVILLFNFGLQAEAQTWDEWFRQRKTQREYLLKQIVALKVYLGYLEKGYKIASEGLSVINKIKNGDFNLHDGFFNSLKSVNPAIRSSARVGDIIFLQLQIVKEGKAALKAGQQSGQFTAREVAYFKKVFDRLFEDCLQAISELLLVITPGELEMSDDERISRIEMLHKEMAEKYRFCKTLGGDTRVLALQRLGEQLELHRSRRLFGVH